MVPFRQEPDEPPPRWPHRRLTDRLVVAFLVGRKQAHTTRIPYGAGFAAWRSWFQTGASDGVPRHQLFGAWRGDRQRAVRLLLGAAGRPPSRMAQPANRLLRSVMSQPADLRRRCPRRVISIPSPGTRGR